MNFGGGCGQKPPAYSSKQRLCRSPCSNLGWLGYGCLKQDRTLIVVNSIGAALQSLYILVYFYYSTTKVGAGPAGSGGGTQQTPTLMAPRCVPQREVLLKVLGLLALLAAGYGFFTCLTPDEDTRQSYLGLFCSTFTIAMYVSPLADLVRKAGWDWGGGCVGGGCVAPGQPLAPRRPR